MASQFTEGQAQRALARFFDWQDKKVFINAFLFSWEMDVCVLTDAGYVWEVEVKTTLEDWRADQHKDKWASKDIDKVSRLYYAVPWPLLKEVPEFVGEHVGLIGLYVTDDGQRLKARLHREAKSKRGYTISPDKLIQLYKTTYYKYWGQISPKHAEEDPPCYIESPESDTHYTGPWLTPSAPSPKAGATPKPTLPPATLNTSKATPRATPREVSLPVSWTKL